MTSAPPAYVERLSIRPRWWVVVIAVALMGSAELFAGFGWPVIVIVLAVVLLPTVTMLWWSSRLTLVVDATGLHIGKHTMSYDDMDSVTALSGPETRLLLGPQADPAAKLFIRGFIREAVVVRPLRATPVPYWLVSTRRPQAVIVAVEAAARASLAP